MAHPTTDTTRPARQAIQHGLVLLSYFLLTIVMTWPLVTQLTTAIPGDSFDGWQNYWNLWWVKTALVDRQQTPFVTDLLYYPTGVGLYFHTLNPFNGLLALPLQLSGSLFIAYNAVVFFSWTVAGYGVYLLTRWMVDRTRPSTIHYPLAAFLAGAIFTFAPVHMAHLLGHMQVMSLQWMPFYALYLLQAVARNRQGKPWVRHALMAGFFLTLAGLCDWYFVLYLFFFTGIVVLWQSKIQNLSWKDLKSAILPASLAGVLMLLLLSPVLIPMVREATQFNFMVRPTSDLYIFSASLLDFLVPNRLHTLWRPESFTWPGNQIAPVSERTISLGYIPLLLALIALWRWRPAVRFWAVTALFFLLLALGPRIHLGNITEADLPTTPSSTTPEWTPFALLNRTVPFMRISRSVSRYALMVQLAVAVMAGIGLATLLQRRRALTSWLLSGALLLLLLGEFWVAPYPMSPPDTPAFYAQIREMAGVRGILNLPMNYDRPGYLLYQTVHHKPLAVAYISRDDPRTLTERIPLLQHFRHLGPDILEVDPVAVGSTVLTDLGIDLVIQDRYKMPGGLERSYTEELANALFTGQAPLYADERITVHRVQPPTKPVPYVLLGAVNWGPREEREDGHRQRALIGRSAPLAIHHAPPQSQLQLRYRTLPGVDLQIRTGDSQTLATFPPTTEAAVVIVDVPAPTPSGSESTINLALSTEQPNGVWIERITLLY
ncbi:MAG: hypothetical protein DYG89_50620 [Caldilinea sp. CFX5]|nr:hypothetical protein [Caldilinea sp. CFX5]